eukprot:TRINITY_DN5065_c0_g1_i1.p1 TRINITY_DN5065_c0_g1~~TRINITY_DN5065_c0_g1_i1.p1  ORF type:complete len:214 (+),score=30.04 TRINITY_DN5065_c0_g1_i1:114-755(+)
MCIRDSRETATDILFENERYLPFRCFSKRHLLPTDRSPWTDEHAGSVADASVLLGDLNRDQAPPGWRWDDVDWRLVPEPGHDGDGWCYAVDFTTSWGEKGRLSCVRRRRYERRRTATGGAWEVVNATAAAADDIIARGARNSTEASRPRNSTEGVASAVGGEAKPFRLPDGVVRAAERGANIASDMFCAGLGGAAGATIGSRVGHRISRAIGL